jgi:hypothetical protein
MTQTKMTIRGPRMRSMIWGAYAAVRRSRPHATLKAAGGREIAEVIEADRQERQQEAARAFSGTGPATRLGYSEASKVIASAPPASRRVPVLAAAAHH